MMATRSGSHPPSDSASRTSSSIVERLNSGTLAFSKSFNLSEHADNLPNVSSIEYTHIRWDLFEHAAIELNEGITLSPSKWIYLPPHTEDIKVSIYHILDAINYGRSFQGESLPAPFLGDVHEAVLEECIATELIGLSPLMLEVMKQVAMYCDSPAPVAIVGEPGTEKLEAARSIHGCSKRGMEQFWTAHCAGLSSQALESNLPVGGTLFLSGIDSANAELQAKVIQVIDEEDVRVIVATDGDPSQTLERDEPLDFLWGHFRDKIEIPPLQLRPTDLPLLLYYHIQRFNAENNRTWSAPDSPGIEGVFYDSLYRAVAYRWPNNVRELASTVREECRSALLDPNAIGPRYLELPDPDEWTFAPDPYDEDDPLGKFVAEEGHYLPLDKLAGFDLAGMMRRIDEHTEPDYRQLWTYKTRCEGVEFDEVESPEEPVKLALVR